MVPTKAQVLAALPHTLPKGTPNRRHHQETISRMRRLLNSQLLKPEMELLFGAVIASATNVRDAVKAEREAIVLDLRSKGYGGLADYVQEGLHVPDTTGDRLLPYVDDWRTSPLPSAPPHVLSVESGS